MQIPLFTSSSDWRPPASLPSFGKRISVDLENNDPELTSKGPAFKRGKGHIAGYALADGDKTIYLPVAHEGGDNLDKGIVEEYVQECLDGADEIVMHNALYDLGWLNHYGFKIRSTTKIMDTMVADALIDEEQDSYSLDALSYKYLKQRKDENLLQAISQSYRDANPGWDTKADMWKLPARYVGPYAEQDARLTFDLLPHQLSLLQEQSLMKVWELECRTTKALVQMTQKGCPVDLAAAEKLYDEMQKRIKIYRKEFGSLDIWSGPQLAEYCDRLDIHYPKTAKGNPSITKDFMANHEHESIKRINELRGLDRLAKVFIHDSILNGHYKGRIHCDYRQTASDDGGTRSGRLAASNPNLQQVPSRSEWGQKIRKLYVPEPGTLWCKSDYSQQEPRLIIHFSLLLNLAAASEAAKFVSAGGKVYSFFEEATGLPYDVCKMLYLGIGYGMGVPKMSATIGVSEGECRSILETFHSRAPFLRGLYDYCMGRASKRGYVKTILGRRSRFEKWQAGFQGPLANSFADAQSLCSGSDRPSRAFTSRALNRVIQGSAADQTKLALCNLYEEGFDVRLQVHDEINCFVENEKEAEQVKEIMETSLKLEVPVVSDVDLGTSWK